MATEPMLVSDVPIPPGEYLSEVIGELGMNQTELAQRMGRPVQAISEIVSGAKAIVPETALQLERVTGVPAHIWTNLESQYRLILARRQDEKNIAAQVPLVTDFPYRDLVKLGLVAETRQPGQRVKELCRFFGVVSLRQIQTVEDYAPAFRAGVGKISGNALAAWLRMATLTAIQLETVPFDRKRLQAELPNLRRLTLAEPARFPVELKQRLASLGIAFVIQPHLPKTCVHGATFWLTQEKAVIVMTIRGSWADVFWFSFFHELAHVLRHGKREVFLEDGPLRKRKADLENEADAFARDILIPPAEYSAFVAHGDYSQNAIARFAERLAIHPGIVTGRLQHDQVLPMNVHWHRDRYKWAE